MFIHFAGEGWCSLDNEFVYALVRAAVFMGSLTFTLISFSVYPLFMKWLYNFINGSTELVVRQDLLLSIMCMINYLNNTNEFSVPRTL